MMMIIMLVLCTLTLRPLSLEQQDKRLKTACIERIRSAYARYD